MLVQINVVRDGDKEGKIDGKKDNFAKELYKHLNALLTLPKFKMVSQHRGRGFHSDVIVG